MQHDEIQQVTWFEWAAQNITFGNIFNVLTLIVFAAGFYFTTNARLDSHDRQLLTINDETKEFRKNLLSALERARDRDTAMDMRMLERLTAVETEVRGLRADLTRIEANRKQN